MLWKYYFAIFLKGQYHMIFYSSFFHRSTLYENQISRLKRFIFCLVFAKLFEFFDESTLWVAAWFQTNFWKIPERRLNLHRIAGIKKGFKIGAVSYSPDSLLLRLPLLTVAGIVLLFSFYSGHSKDSARNN